MGFIDCDSHVIETAQTWSYLGRDEAQFRPQILCFEDDKSDRQGSRTRTEYIRGTGRPPLANKLWVVGDSWARFFPTNSATLPNGNAFEDGVLDLTNPAGRLESLDGLGIDVQVVFSTFFLGAEIINPNEEVALTRSFNRWMAEGLDGYTDRLRWVMRPPIRRLDVALTELEFAKAHGAVGVQLRGIEHGFYLCDPYFYPLYEKALELDLAVFVHNSVATRTQPFPIGNLIPEPPAYMAHLSTLASGFHAVISTDLNERFPGLRWCFAEAGATWAPGVIQQQARRDMSIGMTDFLKIRRMEAGEFAERNIYIAAESDEDLGYLASYLGPEVLCFGTDFGHNDTGSDLGGHVTISRREDLDKGLAEAIVGGNARRMLGIGDVTYAPSGAVSAPEDLPHVKAVAGGPAILYSR
jgi:predicted TIM-barrel fold metal-dependent hydrolase